MAAVTGALIGATALGVAGGIGKAVQGGKMVRDAKRAARKFRRQELKNVFENQRISTVGSEFAREAIAGNMATSAAALQSGGIRGVVGGMQGLQESANRYLQSEAAQLDQQQVQLDRMIAQDNARIRAMQEERDNMELQTIQAQMNAGQQTKWSGFGDVAQSGMSALTAFAGAPVDPAKDVIAQQQNKYGKVNAGSAENAESGIGMLS